MKLNVMERLTAFGLLPEQGNIVNLRRIRTARENLSFTDKEAKEWGIAVDPEGNVRWNPSKAEEVDIELGEGVTDMISEALKKLNKEEKLEPRHMTLYEKFIEMDDDSGEGKKKGVKKTK